MLALVVVEASFLYLQAARGYQTMSAADVDLTAFVLLLITSVVWILYGWFVVKDLPVIVSGILYTVGTSLVLATIVQHG